MVPSFPAPPASLSAEARTSYQDAAKASIARLLDYDRTRIALRAQLNATPRTAEAASRRADLELTLLNLRAEAAQARNEERMRLRDLLVALKENSL